MFRETSETVGIERREVRDALRQCLRLPRREIQRLVVLSCGWHGVGLGVKRLVERFCS